LARDECEENEMEVMNGWRRWGWEWV